MIIHDDVWVGANVFINPGVTIGTNSIVGANSVVTHDVPARTVVAGKSTRMARPLDSAHMPVQP